MEVKPILGSPRLISLQIAEGAFSVIRSAAFCLYLSILVNDEVIKVTEHVLEVVLEPLQAGSLASMCALQVWECDSASSLSLCTCKAGAC